MDVRVECDTQEQLGGVVGIEQQQLDSRGMRRAQGEVYAVGVGLGPFAAWRTCVLRSAATKPSETIVR